MASEPRRDGNGWITAARWVSVGSPWLAAAGMGAVVWAASAFIGPGDIDGASVTRKMWLVAALVLVAAAVSARSLTRYTGLLIGVRLAATLPLLFLVAYNPVWGIVPVTAFLGHLTLAVHAKRPVQAS